MNAQMYPLTDYPHYREEFDTFASLRAAVEDGDASIETFNQIQSWIFIEADGDEGAPEESPTFLLAIFMPRLTKVTEFRTSTFDPDEVQRWLDGYVRGRIERWYGWDE